MSSLEVEAEKRKARLAQLRQAGLKRKRDNDNGAAAADAAAVAGTQIESHSPAIEARADDTDEADAAAEGALRDVATTTTDLRAELDAEATEAAARMRYRNYDPATRSGRSGFLDPPTAAEAEETVENRSKALQLAASRARLAEEAAAAAESGDALISVDKLQPIDGRNADLKRELARRMAKVQPLQDAMIRKFVRERVLALRAKGDTPAAEAAEDGGDLAREVQRREEEARRDTLVDMV